MPFQAGLGKLQQFILFVSVSPQIIKGQEMCIYNAWQVTRACLMRFCTVACIAAMFYFAT
jgi:hypothetical protein